MKFTLTPRNQRGFGHVELVIAILFIGLFAFVGIRVFNFTKAATPLTWAPPSGYQNYAVKNAAVQTNTQTIDAGGGDIWLKLPKVPTGPINLTNCHNVVVIGGQINLPPNSGPGTDMRGFYINGCTGTVHIEGVLINGDIATAEGDGIAIKAPQAIVQLENLRIYKLYGGYNTASHNHSDIVQPWGGVKELRIDHLTGSSNYQGFQINDDQGHIGAVTIKNTNIGDSGVPSADGKGGYYVWLKCGTGTSYTFDNVYLSPRSGRSLSGSIWDGGCGTSVSNNVATFSNAKGSIVGGAPSSGDFVPASVAGINYVSPWNSAGTTTTSTTTTPTPTPTTPTPPPTPTPTVQKPVNETFDTSTSLQAVLGAWTVNGGKYVLTNVKDGTTANGNVAVSSVSVSKDYILTADASVTNTSEPWDDFSVIFGYTDVNNYYYASFNESNDSGTNGIFKVQAGVATQLKDFAATIKSNTTYAVKIAKAGNAYTVSVNGTAFGSVTDTTFASGKVGVGSRNNAVTFDNLIVTQ